MIMARGGSRNRSGPQPVEGSRTSERKGYVLTALPPTGYDGEAPDFPLMGFTVYRWEYEDKRRFQVIDPDATEAFRERENELWAQAWTYPQACAWSMEPWRWNAVAMWVRTQVVCESSDATAADKGTIHRFADQIGMTPAGLKENGWKIAEPKAEADDEPAPEGNVTSIKDRLNRGSA
jgi:hypothetical protein